ncbi:MAG: hypothetical protein D6715_06675 [Calditrichaeota bacterium]|nr:MAG: hypothetical protein D6715_06675 [Calditrichota bacterium]
MLKRLLMVFAVLALVPWLFAGTTGKIAGIVLDKNTGEPLPGVNVVIQGTQLGASTDEDGSFVILNVPAGTYTLVFSYIGYQEVELENIRVVPDLTKRVEVRMEPTTIEFGEAIVVTAERPFFEVSATNTVRVMDSQEIERVPLRGVQQIVAVNAGVVMADGSGGETDNAVLNVRGGRFNETLYIVDGIPINNPVGGNAAGTIPDVAIEQVSAQLGGFSAKYGSAQSGIINIVTKSGGSRYSGGFEGILGTQDYGYKLINGHLSGPVIPGQNLLTFFGSVEYVNTDDNNPRAVPINIPGKDPNDPPIIDNITGKEVIYKPVHSTKLLDNEAEVLRFTSKVDANFTSLKLTASANGSFRDGRNYIHSYAKSNSRHNPRIVEDNWGASLRLSHVLNENTFWDATVRYRYDWFEQMDGVWKRNLDAYGDTLAILNSPERDLLEPGDEFRLVQGSRLSRDRVGVFFKSGRVFNNYTKQKVQTFGFDLNFTKQLQSHLIELGGSWEKNIVRRFAVGPLGLARGIRSKSGGDSLDVENRFFNADPFFYGYDITGKEIDNTSFKELQGDRFEQSGPKRPIVASAYIQDKIEFRDFIVNLGLRWDYFDPAFKRIKTPEAILSNGKPFELDEADFEDAPTESYLSPRLGFAYPVTEHTVFHAQYGIFRQHPRLADLYDAWTSIDDIERDDNFVLQDGHLKSEKTVQYEFGFKQQIGNVASLDITAYYKNVQGLTDILRKVTKVGEQQKIYLTTGNTDFGTIKGLAMQFNLRRLGPLSARVDYTLSLSEGTGSSQSSSLIAAFRNTRGETPKQIAPLDFDQRHTLTASIDIRAQKGQGGPLLENAGANFLITYNSGRPYTPVEFWNLLQGASNQGRVSQYINSAYAEGVFRVDLKIDKTIDLANVQLVPYLWVQNLLDRDNFNSVYRSTGEPDDTGWLKSPEGQQTIRANPYPNTFVSDYKALERNPSNYGIPRLVRLGMKVRF